MFLLPVLYSSALAYTTYKNATHKIFDRKKFTDIQLQEQSSKDPAHTIKRSLQPWLTAQGIRNDLVFGEAGNSPARVIGNNCFPKTDAVLLMAPGFQEADKEACYHVIKHEMGHMKKNDSFLFVLVPAISTIGALLLLCRVMRPLPALLAAIGIENVTRILFTRYREGKADDFANRHSSNEELKGARRYFLALQQCENRPRFDLSHPSLASRLKKVEEELVRRSITVDAEQEQEQIGKLQSFLCKLDLS